MQKKWYPKQVDININTEMQNNFLNDSKCSTIQN